MNDLGLLQPYVEPYFAALRPVWQSRTNEMATQIAVGLYPAQLASPELLERTERGSPRPPSPRSGGSSSRAATAWPARCGPRPGTPRTADVVRIRASPAWVIR